MQQLFIGLLLNPLFISYLIFVGLTVLISITAIAIGMAIGSCVPNADAANAIAPLIMVVSILFGGFLY